MVKPSLEKQPRFKQGATNKTLTSLEKIPAEMTSIAVRVQGIQWLNWLHLTEQSISPRERIKTNCGSRRSRTPCRPDERIKPHNSGRTDRNWSEVATTKAEKLAPVVRGWRNYHKFCKMDGSRNSLYHVQTRAYKVFNKETKQNRYSSKKLLDKAFPAVSYSENKHVLVKRTKSPYDGDTVYWSQRNSKLYDGETSIALKKQNHKCASCGLKFIDEERVHLHHIDGNHANWKKNNLEAIHESCHDYKHMSKSAS